MSNRAYHAIPAMSHSLAVRIKQRGALVAFKESAFNPERIEPGMSDALARGQLYHILMANPDLIENHQAKSFYENVILKPDAKKLKDEILRSISVDNTTIIWVFDFGKSRTNTKYDDIFNYLCQYCKWTDDSIIVNEEELQNAITMCRFLMVHPHYQSTVGVGTVVSREENILFDYQGMPCKAKPDIVLQMPTGRFMVIDYKTTKNTTREENQLCGERLGYHIEDFVYKTAVATKYDVSVDHVDMAYLMQNKEHPEIVYLCEFGQESFEAGKTDFEVAAGDFMHRVPNFKEQGIVAFMDVCGRLQFKHWEDRLLEQPDENI